MSIPCLAIQEKITRLLKEKKEEKKSLVRQKKHQRHGRDVEIIRMGMEILK